MEYQKNKYYEIAIVSDIGERKENEDAYGIDVSEENAAVVVCDGMGGFESGKLASGIAVNELIRLYRQRINQKKIDEDFLIYAMDSVDIRISNLHNEDGKKMHAGSTCVMLTLQKRGMYCLSVGDSRLYLLRNNAIAQLTRDHTVALKAENDYRLEKISYDEYLKLSEDKSTLCSYFGLGGIEIYDLNKELYQLNKNDILVAVTDGLYKSLNINEIKDILLKNRDVKSMAEQLIHKAALFAKGKNQDNTTVAICRIR